jgi:hypothetical protein
MGHRSHKKKSKSEDKNMMRIAKFVVCLGFMAALLASAATRYNVSFRSAAVIAGTEVKPGDYSVELSGSKAMIRGTKQTVEASVQVQQGEQKYSDTTVRYNVVDGKYKVSEIHLGGTKTKLVFDTDSAAAGSR